jgi:4-hydroxy-3-methylbut-2-enyl diphosphate reductase
MIVVGGKNSANTARLAGICSQQGVPVFYIESERDLKPDEIGNYRRIGITGGASTPKWIVERVAATVKKWR